MDELLTLPALEIARRIREKKLSPVEALEAHIKRIEEVNPNLNAVIEYRFEAARAEARTATNALAGNDKSKDLPPFHGVPCTIKDTYAVKGMKWAVGVVRRRNLIAEEDATVVQRYRKAGAIIMGKTNVPEVAMWYESYNRVYGLTRNPHDLSRTVGGSSGGEGSIIAAAGTPMGIGSDVGGSIRYPCHFNGVIGHKPTGGLVPGTGHWPGVEGDLKRYCTYGPMGRSVDDVAALLRIIAGPDGQDSSVEDRPLGDHASIDPKKLTVYYYEDNRLWPVSNETRFTLREAVRGLENSGVKTIPWWPRNMRRAVEMWSAMLALNPGPSFVESLTGSPDTSIVAEIAKNLLGRSEHTFWPLALGLLEPIGKRTPGHNQAMRSMAHELRKEIEHGLGPNGVLMCPVFPTPAFKHYRGWPNFFGISYSALYNILELPATMVPIRKTWNGLPVGVQIVGRRFDDHLTLAMAKRLEEIFGGWSPATPKPRAVY